MRRSVLIFRRVSFLRMESKNYYRWKTVSPQPFLFLGKFPLKTGLSAVTRTLRPIGRVSLHGEGRFPGFELAYSDRWYSGSVFPWWPHRHFRNFFVTDRPIVALWTHRQKSRPGGWSAEPVDHRSVASTFTEAVPLSHIPKSGRQNGESIILSLTKGPRSLTFAQRTAILHIGNDDRSAQGRYCERRWAGTYHRSRHSKSVYRGNRDIPGGDSVLNETVSLFSTISGFPILASRKVFLLLLSRSLSPAFLQEGEGVHKSDDRQRDAWGRRP